jgi:hypothetical protein
VILLVGLEGTSYGQTAMILGVPIGTVRSRLSRGRSSLRELMDRRDGTEAPSGAAIHERQSADAASRNLSYSEYSFAADAAA